MKCGQCKWFDGYGWLDEDGTGCGECCIDPPVWVGPSPAECSEGDFVDFLLRDGWERPKVGVDSRGCSRGVNAWEKRWWEK